MPAESSPTLPLDSRRSSLAFSKSLLWIAGAVLAWFVVTEVATEAWYRWKESQVPETTPWAIDWPTEEDAAKRGFLHFNEREMTPQEQELLSYESAKTASWRDTKGNQWTGFLLEWPEDKRLNQNDVTHNPTVCFPAAGLKLLKALPDVDVALGSNTLRFKAWQFDMKGQTVFVYMASRWVRDLEQVRYREGSVQKRMANLWKAVVGNRGNPLQTIELVVVGPRNEEIAREELGSQLQSLLRREML